MNNSKQIVQQLIKQPITLQYSNIINIVQAIAGLLLLIFFLFLGISIFISGLKAEEYGIYYLLFGSVLCLFPVVVFFIMQLYNNKRITLIDEDGVSTKNNINYKQENLNSITYNTSLYEQNENNRFVSVQFIFSNGDAIATYKADGFSYVLFIANNLQVPKKEKAFTYFK